MIKKEEFLLLAAESTHLVIKNEKLLKEAGVDCRIIPLPSQIKASCGLSIRTDLKDIEKIKEILYNNKMELYLIKKSGLKKEIEKLS